MKTMMHVAHDLQAPLTASQSSIKSILGEYAGPVSKNVLSMLEIAYRRINNATNMVKDMFNLIKFDEQMKRGEIKKEKLQLKSLVEEAIEIFGVEFEGKQVNWQLDIDKDIAIYADAKQFKELFSSLFLNALLYSEDPVDVTIKSFMKSGVLRVQVKDNGIGISPENREKVFDDFFRTLEAKRMARDRVGLGLSVVKKIIAFYGGRIEIEEGLSGRGTGFTISLPGITDEKSSLTEAPQPVRAAGRRFFTPSEEPPSAIDIKW